MQVTTTPGLTQTIQNRVWIDFPSAQSESGMIAQVSLHPEYTISPDVLSG